jgi:hypothetical protein
MSEHKTAAAARARMMMRVLLGTPDLSSSNGSELHPGRRFILYLSTARRLGIVNILRVLVYRSFKRAGIYRFMLPKLKPIPLAFQVNSADNSAEPGVSWADRSTLTEADQLLSGQASYFSLHQYDVGSPPNWFLNPFANVEHAQPQTHWSHITEFSAPIGDIKIVWEMSRFTWATVLARAWRISGNTKYLSVLYAWMQDWWHHNPPNGGPNWMCGQETSIRLINALLSLRIAGLEANAESGLVAFVEAHCQRIAATKFYAVAQDNNHATSEAAGLFVGGTWLAKHGAGVARKRGTRWAKQGRRLLEDATCRLVLPDGSFSQHSLTYHRVMLDTLSVAEAWRRHVEDPPFRQDFYRRASAATRWLGAMIELATGDGPNLGANDGAHPYRMDASAYRDFRPCLQLASFLFMERAALSAGPWDESAAWLGIRLNGSTPPWLADLSSAVFPNGGYVMMRSATGVRVLLRTPTAQFRPAHADALHLDLWWKEKNLLRDGGTYAYAGGGKTAKSLSSLVGHNLPQFDDHDQMQRIGRFLHGDWIRVAGDALVTRNANGQSWAGMYTDFSGVRHHRTVTLTADTLSVLDRVQGFKRKAVLRWRLAPGEWRQTETGCVSDMAEIRVDSSVPVRRMTLETGWESRHYLEKSAIPVLELEIDQSPAVLGTTVTPF